MAAIVHGDEVGSQSARGIAHCTRETLMMKTLMNIRRTHARVAGTIIATVLATIVASANAGPLRDALMQRRAGQGQGQGEESLFGAGAERGPANLPAGIRIVRDVAYGSAARQRFDVYAPMQAHDAPVILLVHGGAWMFGDKSARGVIENKVSRWVPRGIIVISIDYRMLPEAPVLQQAQDVAKALAFAQQHASSWGGDPRKFILMGHSAGAHLVSLVSAEPSLARGQGASPWLGTVALDSAAYDVARIMQGPHYRFYDRVFGSDPSAWAAVSPKQQLDARIAPFLAVCSSKREDSCPQARDFVARADTFGTRTQLLEEDKTHEEINKDLDADVGYTAQVEAFMRSLDPSLANLLEH
jgi:acetyl esterase/lipase